MSTKVEGQQQISIYKIESGISLSDLTLLIPKKYKEQTLNGKPAPGYNLKLFHERYLYTPKWKPFVAPIVQSGQEILSANNSAQQNYVLLLEADSAKSVYAITGGYGHNAIREYINNDFGLDILARLIKKEDKILKAAREKNFVGGIMGATKYFRNNFNLFENESFGKFYQELQATVGKELMVDMFGFSEDDLKRGAVCNAKSSFRINKAIDLNRLLKVIEVCETILQKDPIISINDVKKLTKQKNEDLIKSLDEILLDQLWDSFEKPNDGLPFDICHSEFEEYLTAYSYKAKIHRQRKIEGKDKAVRALLNYFDDDFEFESLIDAGALFGKIRAEKKIKDKEHFCNQIRSLIITSYNHDGVELTNSDFLSHLMGDVTFEGQKFFYVDKCWYQIKPTFIDDLNASCKSIITNYNFHEDLKDWKYNSHTENNYNAQYIGEAQTIVLDKITPENIELCDILKWDDNNLYLIHVKAGFGNTMRDLCAQITIAANRLSQDIRTIPSKDFVKSIYKDLKAKKGKAGYYGLAGNQTDNISEADFLKLFDKNPHFVLAVLDTKNAERDLKNIEDFNSSIAKFSLHALMQGMASSGQNLRIRQIKNASGAASKAA